MSYYFFGVSKRSEKLKSTEAKYRVVATLQLHYWLRRDDPGKIDGESFDWKDMEVIGKGRIL
jgi:hypothetical protein